MKVGIHQRAVPRDKEDHAEVYGQQRLIQPAFAVAEQGVYEIGADDDGKHYQEEDVPGRTHAFCFPAEKAVMNDPERR